MTEEAKSRVTRDVLGLSKEDLSFLTLYGFDVKDSSPLNLGLNDIVEAEGPRD
eukprot:CAMPEP_0184303800 /NCGR_PEP_ID=MMETSP1049-20130417/13482_1 /TAXON_ID=77928 /ORGANISM="Proteomonas sulcata, Strain CCMP704" /LENGTH=52 /DNA_ID=CAMNT_0026615457 /DNA_START=74 /DNA_END=232 /DNA_ORIENTATION=+